MSITRTFSIENLAKIELFLIIIRLCLIVFAVLRVKMCLQLIDDDDDDGIKAMAALTMGTGWRGDERR